MTLVMILNNFLFWGSVLIVATSVENFLRFLISLEFMYLSIICGFCSFAFKPLFAVGTVFGFFVMSIAAVEAVIGFYFVMYMYIKKQSLVFLLRFHCKG